MLRGAKMKRKLLYLSLILLTLTCVANAQISTTAHDFSGNAWTDGEICIVCHTPHNADVTEANQPLWNHESTVATFTVYNNDASMNATVGQPSGSSKLCLSCHDGTVAVDNFGGATGDLSFVGDGDLGTSIGDDHPVSFTYDATLATADGGLYDPTSQTSGLGGTITVDMLADGKVECSSCHDVHDDTHGNFLLMSNDASALCLTCHNK